jgi:hypothetical protein
MKRLLGALVLALLTSGCAYDHRGHRFDPGAVAQLQPGVSTEREAIDKLGPPLADVFNYAGGSKLLHWHYVYGTPIGTSSEALTGILFDSDGKMVRVVFLGCAASFSIGELYQSARSCPD